VSDGDRTAAQTAASIAIEHGDPCLMREFGARRPFKLISRLMSEGRLPTDQLQCAPFHKDETVLYRGFNSDPG